MRAILWLGLTLATASSGWAPAVAQPRPAVADVAPFDEKIASAKAAMLADPHIAGARAHEAEKWAAGRPASPQRARQLATAVWLQGEAALRTTEWRSDLRSVVVAQGLLMYLRPDDVRGLFDRTAARFPAAGFVFDTAPRWFAELAKRGLLRVPQTGYAVPAMPWGMDIVERWRLERRPSVDRLRELHLPAGRGVALGLAYPALERVPLLGDVTMRVFEARLAAA